MKERRKDEIKFINNHTIVIKVIMIDNPILTSYITADEIVLPFLESISSRFGYRIKETSESPGKKCFAQINFNVRKFTLTPEPDADTFAYEDGSLKITMREFYTRNGFHFRDLAEDKKGIEIMATGKIGTHTISASEYCVSPDIEISISSSPQEIKISKIKKDK